MWLQSTDNYMHLSGFCFYVGAVDISAAGPLRSIDYPAVTFDQLVEHADISKDLLDQPCSIEHLTRIAPLIPNWQKYAEALGLSEAQILSIKSDHLLDAEMKAQQVVGLWKQANGFRATYTVFVQVCLQMRNVPLAESICSMIKSELMLCLCKSVVIIVADFSISSYKRCSSSLVSRGFPEISSHW